MAVIEEGLGGQHTISCTPHVRVSISEVRGKQAGTDHAGGRERLFAECRGISYSTHLLHTTHTSVTYLNSHR